LNELLVVTLKSIDPDKKCSMKVLAFPGVTKSHPIKEKDLIYFVEQTQK